jgi:hypothetical protein
MLVGTDASAYYSSSEPSSTESPACGAHPAVACPSINSPFEKDLPWYVNVGRHGRRLFHPPHRLIRQNDQRLHSLGSQAEPSLAALCVMAYHGARLDSSISAVRVDRKEYVCDVERDCRRDAAPRYSIFCKIPFCQIPLFLK